MKKLLDRGTGLSRLARRQHWEVPEFQNRLRPRTRFVIERPPQAAVVAEKADRRNYSIPPKPLAIDCCHKLFEVFRLRFERDDTGVAADRTGEPAGEESHIRSNVDDEG
jgi:hypothetical protein